jgi:phosphatidate cytidylyltransferase
MVAMALFPFIGTGMAGSEGFALFALSPDGWDARIAPAFIAVVWVNDIFAYLVGITLGKHKMAPRISPHKSWEGFAGGIVGATVISALIGRFWAGGEVWLWAAFGLLVAFAAVGGDLVESLLKRSAEVKDSGRILPGHGGMLDRFDATLGAVPVAFLFFLITYLLK